MKSPAVDEGWKEFAAIMNVLEKDCYCHCFLYYNSSFALHT